MAGPDLLAYVRVCVSPNDPPTGLVFRATEPVGAARSPREESCSRACVLRAEQRDPAHGGRAAQIRGAKNSAHQRAVSAWVGEKPDPEVFRTEILPRLRPCAIDELVEATGLSEHYCSLIRLGKRVPHPRHWASLRHLADRRP